MLLTTLTTTWMLGGGYGTVEEKGHIHGLDEWRKTMEGYFSDDYFPKLEEDVGKIGPVALLEVFEFSLYDLVKKAIVKYRDKGVEKVVEEITRVSFSILFGSTAEACYLRSDYPYTTSSTGPLPT